MFIRIFLFIASFVFLSCGTQWVLDRQLLLQGEYRDQASNSNTQNFMSNFAIPDGSWEILYSDKSFIYFARSKGQFKSNTPSIKITGYEGLCKVPLSKLLADIPLYKTLDKSIQDSIATKDGHFRFTPLTARIILRGDSVNYQIRCKSHWHHFEQGAQTGDALLITDRYLNVLDCFQL